jgi:hypothetical protein
MEGVVKDPATISEQMKAVERELKVAIDDYIDTKSSLNTLDGYLTRSMGTSGRSTMYSRTPTSM